MYYFSSVMVEAVVCVAFAAGIQAHRERLRPRTEQVHGSPEAPEAHFFISDLGCSPAAENSKTDSRSHFDTNGGSIPKIRQNPTSDRFLCLVHQRGREHPFCQDQLNLVCRPAVQSQPPYDLEKFVKLQSGQDNRI